MNFSRRVSKVLPILALLILALMSGGGETLLGATISIDSVVNNSYWTDTSDHPGNYLSKNFFGSGEFASTATVTKAGDVGDEAIFVNSGYALLGSTRYTMTSSAESAIYGQVVASTSDYTVTFSASVAPGYSYDLDIRTNRQGALSIAQDSGFVAATADIGAVSGYLDGIANSGLALPDVASLTSVSSKNAPFPPFPLSGQINYLELNGLTGSNTYTLRFVWSNNVRSNEGANITTTNQDLGSEGSGAEAAIRMGLAGSAAGMTADDYPGASGFTRNIAQDGHFVEIYLYVVPEPSSLILASIGTLSAVVVGVCRRRAARRT